MLWVLLSSKHQNALSIERRKIVKMVCCKKNRYRDSPVTELSILPLKMRRVTILGCLSSFYREEKYKLLKKLYE